MVNLHSESYMSPILAKLSLIQCRIPIGQGKRTIGSKTQATWRAYENGWWSSFGERWQENKRGDCGEP